MNLLYFFFFAFNKKNHHDNSKSYNWTSSRIKQTWEWQFQLLVKFIFDPSVEAFLIKLFRVFLSLFDSSLFMKVKSFHVQN